MLQVDASSVGFGTCLMQEGPNGDLWANCFVSTKLRIATLNHSTIEKKTFALVYTLEKKNKIYTKQETHLSIVHSDNDLLKYLMRFKDKIIVCCAGPF